MTRVSPEESLSSGAIGLVPLPARFPGQGDTLPMPRSSFVGRERELERVRSLLERDDVSLVTLTGPGGVGKTRIAIHVAKAFPRTVHFVDLVELRDAGLVLPTIARSIDINPRRRSLFDGLKSVLREGDHLLVLDHFEQVLPAAPALGELLDACSGLKLLVTSRIPLRIEGEQEYAIPPLALPDPRQLPPLPDLARVPAVALFLHRARAVEPTVALTTENASAVAELCIRLDGLPLAIELAAAHSKLLSARAMLARLPDRLSLLTGGRRDRPTRQQTMRDTIAWSYDLLDEDEQSLFRLLAVFSGGFSLEAAEAVSGSEEQAASSKGVETSSFLVLLESLVDKSLLQRAGDLDGEPRLTMLETVRAYALQQLAESAQGETARRRHVDWCFTLAERAAIVFSERGPGKCEARLVPELDNLRAAFTTLETEGDAGTTLRLAIALEPLWTALSHEREGFRWLMRSLERGCDISPSLRNRASILAARLANALGDSPAATAMAEASVAWASAAGDAPGLADAICLLGNIARGLGDQAAAATRYADALARFRSLGDRPNIAYTLIQLSKLGDLGTVERAGNPEDRARAARQCEEALELYRELDNEPGVARALHQLAHTAYRSRDYSRAARLSGEALALRWEHRNLTDAAMSFEDLADLAGKTGHAGTAARLYGVAEALRETRGVPMWPAYRADYEREVAVTRQALAPEVFTAAWAAGRFLPLETAVAEALACAGSLAAGGFGSSAGSATPITVGQELTPREREVLRLLATGQSNQDIADALFLTRGTVKIHVSHILGKLGLPSRSAATDYAHRHNLV